MEPNTLNEGSDNQADANRDMPLITPFNSNVVASITTGEPCPTCRGGAGSTPISYIYAFGDGLDVCIPNSGLEKEIAQVASREDTAGKTDQQVLDEVLAKPENRYLVYDLRWQFRIHGQITYFLEPRHREGLDALLAAYRYGHINKPCYYIIVGQLGPIAPPDYCNGVTVPRAGVDNIYYATSDEFMKSIPRSEEQNAEQFERAATQLLDMLTDNPGATDEGRAFHYAAARVPGIYDEVKKQFDENFSLKAVEGRPAPHYGPLRRRTDIVLTFENRTNGVRRKSFIRIDTTDKYPSLDTPVSPYYDRQF